MNETRKAAALHDANARRTAACVNALAGVTTKDLEGGALARLVESANTAASAAGMDWLEMQLLLASALAPFLPTEDER